MYRVIILIVKLLHERVQISWNQYALQGRKQNRVCTHWSTRRNLSPSLCRHLPLLDNSFLEITIGCLTPLWNQVPSHFSGNVHSETNIANIRVNRLDRSTPSAKNVVSRRVHFWTQSSFEAASPSNAIRSPRRTKKRRRDILVEVIWDKSRRCSKTKGPRSV